LPGYRITDEQLSGLYDKATDDEQEILDQLYESYSAAMNVKTTYAGVREALESIPGSLDSLSGSIDSIIGTLSVINSQIDALMSGNDIDDLISQLEQLGQLADGISVLSENYRLFHSGLVEYTGGVSALAEGYGLFDDGFRDLYTGIEQLSDGITDLSEGVGTLAGETSDMPDRVKAEIDSLISDFSAAPFKPVSFTSGRNGDTGFVQFVLKTDGIEKPAAAEVAPVEAAQPSFLDRLIALFKKT
jgi:X-X-X-Leu-X-X-Gly heptad repeat protein